jgi:shikimate kinase
MLNFEEINPYYKKITLIGMMGTGKSKFGRQIANILKYNFYDIDHMIEKEFKITIKQLFQKHGEVFFRKIEKKTIRDLILNVNKNKEKVIISLGGGGFDNKEIRDLLLSNTNVIWLNTPVDVLVQRVGDGSKRPMIKGKTRDSILQLLKIRTKYYSLCHNQINTEKLNQNQITEKLINLISHQNNIAKNETKHN